MTCAATTTTGRRSGRRKPTKATRITEGKKERKNTRKNRRTSTTTTRATAMAQVSHGSLPQNSQTPYVRKRIFFEGVYDATNRIWNPKIVSVIIFSPCATTVTPKSLIKPREPEAYDPPPTLNPEALNPSTQTLTYQTLLFCRLLL